MRYVLARTRFAGERKTLPTAWYLCAQTLQQAVLWKRTKGTCFHRVDASLFTFRRVYHEKLAWGRPWPFCPRSIFFQATKTTISDQIDRTRFAREIKTLPTAWYLCAQTPPTSCPVNANKENVFPAHRCFIFYYPPGVSREACRRTANGPFIFDR